MRDGRPSSYRGGVRLAQRLTAVEVGVAAVVAPTVLVLLAISRFPVTEIAWVGVSMVLAAVALALAVLVARHAPDNLCGPLLGLTGLTPIVVGGWDSYLYAALVDERLPFSPFLVAFGQGLWTLHFVPVALLMLFFPTGRLLGPRWRVVAVGLVAFPPVFCIATSRPTEPYFPPFDRVTKAFPGSEVSEAISMALLPILLAMLVASVLSLFLRYRAAGADVRLQLRWMAVAATTIPLTLLLCWASFLALGRADLVVVGLLAIALAVPAATAIALVRSTWFDVDALLVRTTVYAVLAGVVLAAVAVVAGLAGVLTARESVIVAVSVTAVTLIALLPLRQRLDASISRLVFPHRERTLRAVGELQRDVHAGVRRPEELEEVLRTALDDPTLRVSYRLPGQVGFVDGTGLPAGPAPRTGGTAIDIELAGDRIGIVSSARRQPSWAAELSRLIALLAEVVRLRLETAQALSHVAATNRRLVEAQEHERQRLQRDLHDGAQQRLVTLGMELRLAQRHLGRDSDGLSQLLDDSVLELQGAVADLRQIAHGLRPSSLDDGLPAALAQLRARSGAPIELSVEVGDVPEAVSVTAYYVANEAVANAVKYAAGRRIALTVRQSSDAITVRVQDDGRGGAEVRRGSGLAGLRDRVRALGGDLTVTSPADRGTLVEAVLPCAS